MYARMPFGKYKGRLLSDVPRDYLAWLLREVDLSDWLGRAVRWELGRGRPDDDFDDAPAVMMPDGLLDRWYRALANRWHPDRGGSVQAMQAVNDAKALLVEMISEVTA